MELWIVRHGQTLANIQKILQGHEPGKLSKLGVDQALRTGIRLSKESFNTIYVSDLGRTRETYENIAHSFKNKDSLPVIYSDLLREKGCGILEGQSVDMWRQKSSEASIPIRKYKCDEGESWEDVTERAKIFLKLLISKHLQGKDNKEEEEKVSNEIKSSSTSKEPSILKVYSNKFQVKDLTLEIGEHKSKSLITTAATTTGQNSKKITSKQGSVDLKSNNEVKKQNDISKKKTEGFSINSCFGNTKKPVEKPVLIPKTGLSKLEPSKTFDGSHGRSKPVDKNPVKDFFDSTIMNKYPKFLIVTHGGYIMEFLNVVCYRNGTLKPVQNNDSLNCSITIVVGCCKKTKGKCLSDCLDDSCLEIKICKKNDTSHLQNSDLSTSPK